MRTIYVSSTGEDFKDASQHNTPTRATCDLDDACREVTRGGAGVLVLRRGDVYNTNAGLRGEYDDHKFPLRVSTWGDESLPPPIVRVSRGAALQASAGCDIAGVVFRAASNRVASGVRLFGEAKHIAASKLRHVVIDGFTHNLNIEGVAGEWPSGQNFDAAGCLFVNAVSRLGGTAQGVYLSGVRGADFTLCGIINNGASQEHEVKREGTNHGAYVVGGCENVDFYHCLVGGNAATGLQLRNNNTSARGCVFIDNAIHVSGGHDMSPSPWCGNITDNVLIGGHDLDVHYFGDGNDPRKLAMALSYLGENANVAGNIIDRWGHGIEGASLWMPAERSERRESTLDAFANKLAACVRDNVVFDLSNENTIRDDRRIIPNISPERQHKGPSMQDLPLSPSDFATLVIPRHNWRKEINAVATDLMQRCVRLWNTDPAAAARELSFARTWIRSAYIEAIVAERVAQSALVPTWVLRELNTNETSKRTA